MNIKIGSGGKEISWDYGGKKVKKSYSDVLMGYEILPDDSGIVLLEPVTQVGAENAVIYNTDGTQRWRLPFPPDIGTGLLFDQVGMSAGELIVIGIVNGRDIKFLVDYTKLEYQNIILTR